MGATACLLAALCAPGPARADEPATGVLVRRFEIDGARAVPDAELQAVLAPWLNTVAGRDDLAKAARALERSYQSEHRLVARVTLPPQDITDGVVRLHVAEARMGQVMVQGNAVRAIGVERAAAIVQAAQAPNTLLRIDAVDRATALLNEWPGLSAASALVAGSKPGETDVALSLDDRRAWDATLRLDNEGARATGAARLSADATLVVPGGGGQTLGIGTVWTEGSRLLRLSGSTPLSDDGWRASLYGSALKYELVAPEFNSLDVKGPSDTLGASMAWAAQRSAAASADVSAQLERRRFDNQALGTTLSKYHVDALTVRVARQWSGADGLVRSAADFSAVGGRVDLHGSPNEAGDALTARTAGRYGLLRATLQRAQTISPTQNWTVKLSGQLAAKNLDVSERLPIAGPSGVRAYPVGEASGSDALFASAEWQQSLGGIGRSDMAVAGFADYGVAAPLHNPHFAGAPATNRLALAGAGVWIEWRPAGYAVVARLTVAQPVGPHPDPTAAGTNQDGSRIGTRVWASAQWAL